MYPAEPVLNKGVEPIVKKVFRKFRRNKAVTLPLAVVTASMFAVMLSAQAARPSVIIEAESGNLNGAIATAADNTASGGSLLSFGGDSQASQWAFEETFSGTPANPSQLLLPKSFDYVVTHRSHPAVPNGPWGTFPADHNGNDCAGPPAQHTVGTNHTSNGANPDQSFFICRDHMMSSMGDVDGYSVTSFFPKQEFDFASSNGIIEFDTNINYNNGRSWFEVMIAPRNETRLGAAEDWLPIDETYPRNRIVFTWAAWEQRREIKVGTGAIAPDGWIARQNDWRSWGSHIAPSDPANTDRAIRRKHRLIITNNRITWQLQKQDGTFDSINLDIPQGLPFKRGLVMFKTHAYTPQKDGNNNLYTYHWDNIRFNGPKLPRYTNYEISALANLEGNGSVPIGTTRTQTLDIPKMGTNQMLVAQIQQLHKGQTLLSINGGPNIEMSQYGDINCWSSGWATINMPLAPGVLRAGTNTFKWTVGPRNPCMSEWSFDGFAVKAFEIQQDE